MKNIIIIPNEKMNTYQNATQDATMITEKLSDEAISGYHYPIIESILERLEEHPKENIEIVACLLDHSQKTSDNLEILVEELSSTINTSSFIIRKMYVDRHYESNTVLKIINDIKDNDIVNIDATYASKSLLLNLCIAAQYAAIHKNNVFLNKVVDGSEDLTSLIYMNKILMANTPPQVIIQMLQAEERLNALDEEYE